MFFLSIVVSSSLFETLFYCVPFPFFFWLCVCGYGGWLIPKLEFYMSSGSRVILIKRWADDRRLFFCFFFYSCLNDDDSRTPSLIRFCFMCLFVFSTYCLHLLMRPCSNCGRMCKDGTRIPLNVVIIWTREYHHLSCQCATRRRRELPQCVAHVLNSARRFFLIKKKKKNRLDITQGTSVIYRVLCILSAALSWFSLDVECSRNA